MKEIEVEIQRDRTLKAYEIYISEVCSNWLDCNLRSGDIGVFQSDNGVVVVLTDKFVKKLYESICSNK